VILCLCVCVLCLCLCLCVRVCGGGGGGHVHPPMHVLTRWMPRSHCFTQTGVRIKMDPLWNHPRTLTVVASISRDEKGFDEALGRAAYGWGIWKVSTYGVPTCQSSLSTMRHSATCMRHVCASASARILQACACVSLCAEV
jgi:hypothetical protein